MTDIVDELRARALQGRFNLEAADEIERLRAELSEQCRLLGMSGEREAKHLAQIAALEKERDALRARIEAMEPTMQDALMKFDPATGEERPYPSHATQYRNWHGTAAWLFDPWTGKRRNAYDVGSDVHGLLIAPAGTLGMDMGGGCATTTRASDAARSDARSGACGRPPKTGGIEMIDIKELRKVIADCYWPTSPVAINEILDRLEAAEKERDALLVELKEVRYGVAVAHDTIKALRAKIAEMERQEPVMWANSSNINSSRINRERGGCGDQHTCSETQTTYHDTQLYALPGAKGEEK